MTRNTLYKLSFGKKLLIALSMIGMSAQTFAASTEVINHKSPYCGCCGDWADYMKEQGFTVKEELHENMAPIKQKFGITSEMASCHTAVIDGYAFEGHIPAEDIRAFLANPPKGSKGLTASGMPLGSPGMDYGDDNKQAYTVYSFNDDGKLTEFAKHNEK